MINSFVIKSKKNHKLAFSKNATKSIKEFFLIILGIFSASFGLKGFLLVNHFIDGGATGISLLIAALTNIPLYILIICVNIPFMILAYKFMGRSFAIKATLAIIGLSLCLAIIKFPTVTKDNLLDAVFGGFFLGIGIGLVIRGGAVIDGTDALAVYLSQKLRTTIGDIIIVINVVIFSTAAYFLGVEIAFYSIITYFAASKALDFIIEGIEEYIGVTIISTYNEEIRKMIIEKIGRGVTIYKGRGGFDKTGKKQEIDIIYTIVTRLELIKLNAEIEKIDPNAFLVFSSVKDIKGGVVKKRPLRH